MLRRLARQAGVLSLVVGALMCRVEIGLAQADALGDAPPAGALLQLGTPRWRHATGVYFVAIMPGNKSILTASKDHVIRLWDRETGKEIRRFESSSVRKPFRPHPFKFYSGIDPDDGFISKVTVTPDGKTLAAVLPNNVIQLWDVHSGKETGQFKRPRPGAIAIRFSPSGKMLAVRDWGQVASVYDLETGKVLHIKNDSKDGDVSPGCTAGMAFSPDGTILANGRMGFDQANQFTFVQFLNPNTGAEIRRFDTAMKNPAAIAFAPDGKLFAYSAGDVVHLRETGSGNEIRQIKTPASVTAIVFTPCGKTIVGKALDQQVRVWNPVSGKLLNEWGENAAFPVQLLNRASEECNLALSGDGKVVAWGDGQTVRLWDAIAGKDIAPLVGHRAAVAALGHSLDSRTLISHGEDDTLRRWDLLSGKQLDQRPVPAGTTIAAIAPNAQTVALANADGTIRLVELATGKELRQFRGHFSANPDRLNDTVDLAFSPDGKILASQGSFDCSIRLHDAIRGGEPRQIMFGDGGNARTFRPEFVVRGGLGLAFSADGQTIAACETHTLGGGEAGWHTAKLRQWDVATGKELRAFTLPSRRLVVQIAFSPDGRLLAAMHADQTVSLYETASGRERTLLGKPKPSQLVSAWIYQRRYEPPPVRVLAFSPDGKLLLSRSPVDIIRAWDVHAAVEIAQFPGHDGAVLAVAFAPDGRSFVTGGNDTTILRWDVQRLKRAAALPVTRVEPGEIESLWGDLAGEDAVKAFASMRKMVSAPTEAVAFLRQQLKPVVAFERVDQLVANLDSGDFRTRTQAAKELESLGESALSALKKAHVSASLEARRRIEPLLEKLTPNALTTEQVRLVRSVEVLERIGSAEARQVLGALANGAPDALLTRQARAVLNRHSGP